MVIGTSHSNPSKGPLCIKVENIVLGIGSQQTLQTSASTELPSTPKRKFNAFGGSLQPKASTYVPSNFICLFSILKFYLFPFSSAVVVDTPALATNSNVTQFVFFFFGL